MLKKSQQLIVLLEPTNACNLRCLHCYHAETGYDMRTMPIETLDKFLQITSPHYKSIRIIWHGGEPLLAGYMFFEKAYERFDDFSRKHNCKFSFSIQTNGTLLTDEFISLFKKSGTNISISYDGPFNSILRQETKHVEDVICKLQKNGIKFSCLSTISSASQEQLLELYDYFKQRNIPVKFNHIFPDGAAKKHIDLAVSKEEWTANFLKLFNHWLYDEKCNIRLASCIDILHQYFGIEAGCLNHACLFRYIAVDACGDIYPCGRLIKDGFRLTNVNKIDDVREAFLSKNYKRLLKSNESRMANCQDCKWYKNCYAGCNASCHLSGSITKKSEFECYFINNIFNNIKNQLADLKLNKLNPYARRIIEENIEIDF